MYQRPFTAEASAKHSWKRQLHTTHVGAVGWEPHGTCSHDSRGEGGSGVTLISVPVVASGKRKTEENLIFHDNFTCIQCSTEKFSFFCAAFLQEYSYICSHYVLPFTSFNSMLCCLLKISKCLWLWWWWRSEVRFEGLPEFIWSDLGEQDVVRQGSFGAVFIVFDSSG